MSRQSQSITCLFVLTISLSIPTRLVAQEETKLAPLTDEQRIALTIYDAALKKVDRQFRVSASRRVRELAKDKGRIEILTRGYRWELAQSNYLIDAQGVLDGVTGYRAGLKSVVGLANWQLNGIDQDIATVTKETQEGAIREAWRHLSSVEQKQILDAEILSPELLAVLEPVKDVLSIPDIPRIENSIGMVFCQIPKGAFQMGKQDEMWIRLYHHVREVTMSSPFWMAETELTQPKYEQIMGSNPSSYVPSTTGWFGAKIENKYPVDKVTWYDAVRFCQKLSELPEEVKQNHYYRLPTEAEWEYACRAGTTTTYYFGQATAYRGAEANLPYSPAEKASIKEVGTYLPNHFGLYDMHGNVAEWCGDWFAEDYYKAAPSNDPPGPAAGDVEMVTSLSADLPKKPKEERKVMRGGGARTELGYKTASSAARQAFAPSQANGTIRVVLEIGEPSAITQEQYAQVRAFDNGIPRRAVVDASKQYYQNVKQFQETNEARATELLKIKNVEKEHFMELWERTRNLDDVWELMAREYRDAGDAQRAKAAYLKSAFWQEKHLYAVSLDKELYNQRRANDSNSDTAETYRKGGDLKKARQLAEGVLLQDPNHESAKRVLTRISEDEAAQK
ncbi:MAG: formylglycine-generating enzyme family protein [Planctomycetales bacterium]|nr:formylglycine-generating enzyme family protein [Planctomycetales bacterium]